MLNLHTIRSLGRGFRTSYPLGEAEPLPAPIRAALERLRQKEAGLQAPARPSSGELAQHAH